MPSKPLPEWAQFLQAEISHFDTLPIKKLRALAKRAHLNAGGGKSELVRRLTDFSHSKEAPEWFKEQKDVHDRLVYCDENAKKFQMKVGHYMRIPCVARKMYGTDIQVEDREPPDCIETSVRNKKNPRVGNTSYGNQIVKVCALAPGTAVLVHYTRPGPISDWVPSKRVRITINE
jgi:hypothetical protein